MSTMGQRWANWRANPRRWRPGYIVRSMIGIARHNMRAAETPKGRAALMQPEIESEYVELLLDAEFRRSVDEVKAHSCQDVARLANLWTTVKRAGAGTFLEVGSYRGGTALHICNAMPQQGSRFYCVDPFEDGGYESKNEWERGHETTSFMDTSFEAVKRLLAGKPFATVVRGYFPAAAEPLDLRGIVFCHLDVNMQDATRRCLEYLAPRMDARGVILVDDVGHSECPGVAMAVEEFLASHGTWRAIPMFPCQAVLLKTTL